MMNILSGDSGKKSSGADIFFLETIPQFSFQTSSLFFIQEIINILSPVQIDFVESNQNRFVLYFEHRQGFIDCFYMLQISRMRNIHYMDQNITFLCFLQS